MVDVYINGTPYYYLSFSILYGPSPYSSPYGPNGYLPLFLATKKKFSLMRYCTILDRWPTKTIHCTNNKFVNCCVCVSERARLTQMFAFAFDNSQLGSPNGLKKYLNWIFWHAGYRLKGYFFLQSFLFLNAYFLLRLYKLSRKTII